MKFKLILWILILVSTLVGLIYAEVSWLNKHPKFDCSSARKTFSIYLGKATLDDAWGLNTIKDSDMKSVYAIVNSAPSCFPPLIVDAVKQNPAGK